MRTFNLFDISKPKQWKTISSEDLIEGGIYPVYGANGIIGFYDKYNHEKETVLITCRGATCGEVNLSKPFSYINGNAMALDDIDESLISTKYLFYYFKQYNFQSVISGSAQPQITRAGLKNVTVPIPDLETQNKIVTILDKVNALVQKRQQTIDLLDELLIAQFLEMFGDPISNNRKWEIKVLGEVATLERGRFSPRPRNDPSYFGGEHPFIQTGDISKANHRLFEHTQTLNEKGIAVSKEFKSGTIVIAIVGATIGATAILMFDVYATDSIIGINSNQGKSNNIFLEMILRFYKQVLIDKAPEAARANINLGILNILEIIQPPFDQQEKYSQLSNAIEKKRKILISSKSQFEDLFSSILQGAFSGKLNLDISVELDALLEEIDLQKPENDLYSILSNEEYVNILVERLNKQDFENQDLYDKAKHAAFQLLKTDEILAQKYDEASKSLKLLVK